MKVLVSDNLGDIGIKMFQEESGIEVDVKTGLAPDELKSIIGDYSALVIRSATKVTEDILEAADNLKAVGRAGIGLDNVDIPAATKRGVVVMNTPTGNVITTAEHTIAMMMAMTRNIPWGTSTLKAGLWEKKKLQGREVFNKVLGVIGFGKIGSIVADRARGLKMQVIVHDSFVTPEQIEKAGFEPVALDELYRRADYITLHVPKLKNTIGFLNKAAFEKMKDGVMIINCARGGIVDEADINEALRSGKVAGAALDVFEHEPPGVCPLFEVDRVICTPHLGASTLEAQTNVAVQVAEQIIAYLKGGTIINAVNVPAVSGELLEKIGPLLTLSDRMGCLLAQLATGPVKEVVIEYAGQLETTATPFIVDAAFSTILEPMDAEIMGKTLHYSFNPQWGKGRGYQMKEWYRTDETVQWTFSTLREAEFDIELHYGAVDECNANKLLLTIGDQEIRSAVKSTGDWYSLQDHQVGSIKLEANREYTLTIRPLKTSSCSLMNLQAVRLLPIVR